MTSRPLTKTHCPQNGFTLTELMVAALISMITATVAGEALIAHIKSAEKAESMERQRESWTQAATFIEAEIALSERVFDLTANSDALNVPSECSTLLGSTIENNQLRLGLDQSRLQKPVIYFVKASDTGWLQNFTLWRCGPEFDNLGRPRNSTLSVSRILDGLDGTNLSTSGFQVTALGANHKAASFTITLKGHALSHSYKQADASQARILPLFNRPNDFTLCIGNSYIKLAGKSEAESLQVADGEINEGEDILICGYGGGDTITGSDNANDILDGGEDGGATGALLIGKSGNDRLRGTNSGDVLDGGDDDDVLIGRAGNDHLIGGCGVNQYLTGEGNDIVYGDGLAYTLSKGAIPISAGEQRCNSAIPFDIVFYAGNKSDYIIPAESGESCTAETCKVKKVVGGTTISLDTLRGVEVIIFDDARFDLSVP